MENNKYNVLIIDDHPIIAEAYKSAFHHIETQQEAISFEIQVAHDCDSACEILGMSSENEPAIDIVFLDMRLPQSSDGKILSGEDLGLQINSLIPNCKIIVSTTFNDNYRIHNIFKSLNPDGFLIKNDITTGELVTAILDVISNPPYYSKTVIKLLRKQFSTDFLIDDIDRKILYELSIGSRIKDLSNILPLSIPAIEKRKRHLKHVFDIKGQDDRELILIAKDKGFI